MPLLEVSQTHSSRWFSEELERDFRPLDEDERVLEIRLQFGPVRLGDDAEAIEIEMRNGHRPRVPMSNRERWARNGRSNAERAAGPTDKCRLPAAQFAGDSHEITHADMLCHFGGDSFGLVGGSRLEFDHSHVSWLSRATGLDA